MKFIILSLCLATASAAPSVFHYLPHYASSRGQVPPSQVRNPFTAGQSLPQMPGLSGLPGLPGAYSVELIYPHRFPLGAGGSAAQPFATHGFIKYSIPQPPGRQSVEVYYPYDFSQQRIMTNMPPMTNVPQMPNVMPYDYPLQNNPQQNPIMPSFDSPIPSQVPLQPVQQDQPAQTSQMPAKA
ncbi:secretory calcium-binding phosphoprotein 5 [Sebastes fasciatus]|uniref:secretory calcium-binding phosphoprotein 5 n=1 Tax=Sebastes fasciatus TaxID=394691 RepID=UPI003D9E54B1